MICKNCIHNDICHTIGDLTALNIEFDEDGMHCMYYKDKSQIVDLPCEIRNEVYIIRSANPVSNLYYITKYCAIGFSDVEIFLLDPNERTSRICRDCENIYYDKAKAQSKLKELNDKCQL